MTIIAGTQALDADRGKRRVLVAGGAGFLGSYLCQSLIAQGHAVVCLDNFLTGRRINIAHLLGHPRFTLVEHDIVKPLPDPGYIDRIYNLACAASPGSLTMKG